MSASLPGREPATNETAPQRAANPIAPVWVSPAEASTITGIPTATLAAWRCRGQGPAYAKIGQAIRYNVQDLHDWFAARLVRNTAETAPPLEERDPAPRRRKAPNGGR